MNRPLLFLVCGITIALVVLPAMPVRADFFDDARKTLQTDIPHFFQDDIPCAFGGQPTSHTKSACKSPDPAAKPPARQNGEAAAAPLRGHATPAGADRKAADPLRH